MDIRILLVEDSELTRRMIVRCCRRVTGRFVEKPKTDSLE
jgi:hypothetical protein